MTSSPDARTHGATARRCAALFVVLLGAAGSARCNAPELDVDLMHGIEDANKSLASNIAVGDAAASLRDADELAAMFTQVEDFYVGKADAPDAVDLARKSRALSQRIREAVDGKDFGAAQNAATDLSRTCKTCHNFYKKS